MLKNQEIIISKYLYFIGYIKCKKPAQTSRLAFRNAFYSLKLDSGLYGKVETKLIEVAELVAKQAFIVVSF